MTKKRRRGRPAGQQFGDVVRLRLTAEQLAAVRAAARHDGLSVSGLIRRAVQAWLDASR